MWTDLNQICQFCFFIFIKQVRSSLISIVFVCSVCQIPVYSFPVKSSFVDRLVHRCAFRWFSRYALFVVWGMYVLLYISFLLVFFFFFGCVFFCLFLLFCRWSLNYFSTQLHGIERWTKKLTSQKWHRKMVSKWSFWMNIDDKYFT